MFGGYLRALLLMGPARLAGLRISEQLVEGRIAGGRAISVRSKIAHRALLARLFRQMKRHAQP